MPHRIVIAEDDELLQQLLEHKLSKHGYVVTKAHDGEGALELAQRTRPDLVVLDMMMPALDGAEVLRRLQSDPSTRSIPVIVLSARNQQEDIVSALRLGASDYVVKPFMPAEFLARVERMLARRALEAPELQAT